MWQFAGPLGQQQNRTCQSTARRSHIGFDHKKRLSRAPLVCSRCLHINAWGLGLREITEVLLHLFFYFLEQSTKQELRIFYPSGVISRPLPCTTLATNVETSKDRLVDARTYTHTNTT